MAALNELIQKVENPELRAQIQAAADKLTEQKQFGLVFEEHLPECTPLYDLPIKKGTKVALKAGEISDYYTVLKIKDGKALCIKGKDKTVEFDVDELVCVAEFGEPIYPSLQALDSVCNAPDSDLWHTLIEADNYHALQLLEYLYAGKVDCIYIDPPYNKPDTKDWKYNNNYVDGSDAYRHSKWLSMMNKRLKIAKNLLDPSDSVLIVTIDEMEYLHLGCLLEDIFPDAAIQMVSITINPSGAVRKNLFARSDEYAFFVLLGGAKVIQQKGDGNQTEARWWYLRRLEYSSRRSAGRPLQFYPIYIDNKTERIVKIGDPLKPDQSRDREYILRGDVWHDYHTMNRQKTQQKPFDQYVSSTRWQEIHPVKNLVSELLILPLSAQVDLCKRLVARHALEPGQVRYARTAPALVAFSCRERCF